MPATYTTYNSCLNLHTNHLLDTCILYDAPCLRQLATCHVRLTGSNSVQAGLLQLHIAALPWGLLTTVTVLSLLQEIAAWLSAPGNEQEFIIVFFDDNDDLLEWGKVGSMMAQIAEVSRHPLQLAAWFTVAWYCSLVNALRHWNSAVFE